MFTRRYHRENKDDSDEDMKIEILDYDGVRHRKHTYSVSKKFTSINEKRLVCYSIINGSECQYGKNCTYAHRQEDQIIDEDRLSVYRIILDKNLRDFNNISDQKKLFLYTQLLFCSNTCEQCINMKCPGGFNCRNGTNTHDLKICKNDFLTGECLNKKCEITIHKNITDKITNINKADNYEGCINGHHLTQRGLIPYYKYLHLRKEHYKTKYDSTNYIDLNNIMRLNSGKNRIFQDSSSEESSDDEIRSWFKKTDIC